MSDSWPKPDSIHRSLASFAYQSMSVAFTPLPEYVHNRAVWLGYFRHLERIDRLCPHVRSRMDECVYPDIRVMTRREDLRYRNDIKTAVHRLRALLIPVRVDDERNVTAKDDARREHERTLKRCPCGRCRR